MLIDARVPTRSTDADFPHQHMKVVTTPYGGTAAYFRSGAYMRAMEEDLMYYAKSTSEDMQQQQLRLVENRALQAKRAVASINREFNFMRYHMEQKFCRSFRLFKCRNFFSVRIYLLRLAL
jgi:predicted ATP-dependent endonuclease of OLD family